MLAEQHEKWIEARRYLGIERLHPAQVVGITVAEDNESQDTDPGPAAST